MHVIPSIDLRGGRCVRLRQGRFDAVTEYNVDVLEQARIYARAGFKWVHLVDLDGCLAGQPVNAGIIRAIATTCGINVQAGGGIRDRAAVQACLDNRVRRVVIGSTAFQSPERVACWLDELGPERIVIAADVRIEGGMLLPVIEGWQSDARTDLFATLDFFVKRGMRHALCTSVARDGMLQGPELSLYRELCRRFPSLLIQASGGVRDERDLEALQAIGTASAIVGKSLLDGNMQIGEIGHWAPAE